MVSLRLLFGFASVMFIHRLGLVILIVRFGLVMFIVRIDLEMLNVWFRFSNLYIKIGLV